MNIYANLFITFFRIGAFTIGGGYAMLPLIQHEVVDKHNWLSEDDFLNSTALAQSAPGPIAVNIAVLTGYRLKKFPGSIVTTLGAILPSIIIMTAIASLFKIVYGTEVLAHAFVGIRPIVTALIVSAVIKMAKKQKLYGLAFGAVSFILVSFLQVSPIYVILGAIVFGVSLQLFRGRK